MTDIECGGGFYVRSLVDDLGKGETQFPLQHINLLTASAENNQSVLVCCSSVIMCSCEGADPDQAGSVHSGGAHLTRGALDTGTYPASSAALLGLSDGLWTAQNHLRKTF